MLENLIKKIFGKNNNKKTETMTEQIDYYSAVKLIRATEDQEIIKGIDIQGYHALSISQEKVSRSDVLNFLRIEFEPHTYDFHPNQGYSSEGLHKVTKYNNGEESHKIQLVHFDYKVYGSIINRGISFKGCTITYTTMPKH